MYIYRKYTKKTINALRDYHELSTEACDLVRTVISFYICTYYFNQVLYLSSYSINWQTFLITMLRELYIRDARSNILRLSHFKK